MAVVVGFYYDVISCELACGVTRPRSVAATHSSTCVRCKVQIPPDGPDQTLSETRVSDKVRWVRVGLRQVRGLCLVVSGP